MRNGLIELYRFVFIVIICLMHFLTNYYGSLETDFLSGGYLPVEFFFILSGFFLSKQAYTEKNFQSVYAYAAEKIKRFYPLYIFSVLAMSIFLCLANQKILLSPINFMLEMLMLSFLCGPINPPSWFLSTLIFLSPILYFLLTRYKNITYILAPYIIIAVYINLLWDFNLLDIWHQPYAFFTAGVYRGLADMLLGIFSYKIYTHLRKCTINKNLIFIIEILCLFILLYEICYFARTVNDFTVPVLFSILIISAFMPQIKYMYILNNKTVIFFGKLSLSLFLNHWIVLQILLIYAKNLNISLLLAIYLIIAASYSFAAMKITEYITRRVFK